MGAPNRTSSDVPDFSTYPSSPRDQSPSNQSLGNQSFSIKDPIAGGHLLSAHDPSAVLHDVATEVGTRLGEGMNVVREARDRALDRVESLRESIGGLYGSARDRSSELAQEKFDLLRSESQVQLRRAKQYAEARPLAVIAVAGVAGLLLGAGVRAWRGNRG